MKTRVAKVFIGVAALVAFTGCATSSYSHLSETAIRLHKYEPIPSDLGPERIEREVAGYKRFTGFAEFAQGRRYAIGDLDHDGKHDTVMISTFESTGTWALRIGFVALSSIRSRILTFEVGGRFGNGRLDETVSIQDFEIRVSGVKYGPGNALCCPTYPFTTAFRIRDLSLVEEMPNQPVQRTGASARR